MKTKRFRLTTPAKILLMVLIVALVGGGIFAGVKTGHVKTKNVQDMVDSDGNVLNFDKESKDTINLSLDEWIG